MRIANSERGQRALAVLLVAVLAVTGCRGRTAPRVGVVASTSLIAAIVDAVGGGRFAVTTVAPAVGCPGQFDAKPADVITASQARLVVNQGWEPWFPNFVTAVENAIQGSRTQPRFVTASTQGNWMVPDVHKAASREIAALLAELEPRYADVIRARAQRYETQVDSAARVAKMMFWRRALPAVLASEKQEPFLTWLGFRMVATYGRAEDFSAQELTRLARVAIDSSVQLVVDNQQTGPEAGQPLAQSLKVKHVTLTNFPMDRDYAGTLLANAEALARALK